MNKETIEYIRDKHKFPMTVDDYTNYFIFIFPLALVVIGLTMAYNFFKFHSEISILLSSTLLISFGLLFFYFTTKRLRETIAFESVLLPVNDSIESIADKLKTNFKIKDINVDRDSGSIAAYTRVSAFSWGEKLTLIIDKNTILINSRPGGTMVQPVTIFKDKSNIKRIRLLLSNENSL